MCARVTWPWAEGKALSRRGRGMACVAGRGLGGAGQIAREGLMAATRCLGDK